MSDVEPLINGGTYFSDFQQGPLPIGSIQDNEINGLPIAAANGICEEDHICPCEQNGDCRHQCCVEKIQTDKTLIQKKAAIKLESNSGKILSQTNNLGSAASSYGSLEGNMNFTMKCPVNASTEASTPEEEDSSIHSHQPLMHGNADLVSGFSFCSS